MVTKVAATPSKPNRAQFVRLMKPIKAWEEEKTVFEGRTWRCRKADSTFSLNGTLAHAQWIANYCWVEN